jgi:hypothetical protein
MENNQYYIDTKSFIRIGKIDENVRKLMGELEEAIPWREWSLTTVWRSNDIEKCEALINMLEDRKKDIELNKMMDETMNLFSHVNAPKLDEIQKVQIAEIQRMEAREENKNN